MDEATGPPAYRFDKALETPGKGGYCVEPFTIDCATCGSHIRVRNAALIGQLVHCPKCQAMVLVAIQEPTPSNGAGGQPRIEVGGAGAYVDSTAMTQDGLAVDEYRLAPNEPPDEPLAEPLAGPLEAPPVQPRSLKSPDAQQVVGSLEFEEWGGSAPTLPDDGPAHLPSEHWTSPSTTKKRQQLLVIFLALTGIAVSVFLFFAFLQWLDSDSAQSANDPSELAAAAQPDEPIDAAGQQIEPPEIAGQSNDPGVDNSEDISENDIPIKSVGPNDPLDNDQLGSGTDAGDRSPVVGSGETNPTDSNVANPATDDHGTTAADSAQPDEQVVEGSAPNAAALELPKRLQAFGPMLDYAIQPQFVDGVELLSEAPVTAEDLGLTTGQATSAIPTVDVEQQSQVILPALVIAPLPLSQFVSVWSNVSGIPTVVNVDSLAAAGIDRNQTLALSMVKSSPIGPLADRLGEPLGIETIRHAEGYLQMSAPNEKIEARLPEKFDLRGLVDDAAAEQWLKDALMALFPEQAIEWHVEHGELSRPAVDGMVWFTAVRLLDGWRVAAGLASALPQYDAALLSSELVSPSDVVGLDHVLMEIQVESRPLSQVIPGLCREAGVHAWLDWPHLASLGVGPQTTALVVTSQRPLRRALADYVSEFPMTVAVVDRQTLWMTSNAAYRARPKLYVVPSAGDDVEKWTSRLRPLTPSAVFSSEVASDDAAAPGAVSSGVGSVVVRATPDGRFMLVRCCPMTVSFQP